MNVEKYKKTGKFKLSSGQTTDHYYDLKEAMGQPHNLHKIFNDIVIKIPPDVEVFIGLDYGGVPLAVMCSLMTGKPYAVLRKEQKEYGMQKRIEGYDKKGKTVVLDDVENTGETMRNAVKYLRENGYNVIKTLTIMKRDNK